MPRPVHVLVCPLDRSTQSLVGGCRRGFTLPALCRISERIACCSTLRYGED